MNSIYSNGLGVKGNSISKNEKFKGGGLMGIKEQHDSRLSSLISRLEQKGYASQ